MPVDAPAPDSEVRTRRSLISRLRNLDDQDSWQEFFNTYWKAQEVVQETTIAVSKYIPDYKYDPKVCSFKGWLLHKTRWKIIDQARKRPPGFVQPFHTAGETFRTPTIERLPDPESLDLESMWDDEWKKNLVDAAMERVKRRIKPEHYQIFFLCAVRHLAPRQVAKTMGVNVAQVYLVKHRVAALIKKEVLVLERGKR
jgi:RNA polymerase sigma factor (sigma-70 family)